ncbi:hypothetical protein CC1G_05567 [Coprinopsis cinerea okayama7|uniref:F-box domain-containing protein n=1 Tax=Coprinopsis cinerea (strain Okayama-7 / 130 / ATCC MYA-4618 / FGSC 9003) TaxID=240176 RepID=A8P1F7_COPC7|nr:hypothetical protein CC1G_05567 [Coprinopsis cinerea okayama7\|eukprot:XP_001838086.2 hypothetical protein CC1G_05567 [Coprinopsis cinerea okayama7\
MATWSDIPFDIMENVLAILSLSGVSVAQKDQHRQLQDLINVSAVCRTWRAHTINAKSAWANVAGAHKVSPTISSAILTRSGDYPLVISSVIPANFGISSLTGHHWDAIRANFHRVRGFVAEFEGKPDIPPLLATLSLPAPSLVGLFLTSKTYARIDVPALLANSAPALRFVCIRNLDVVNTVAPALQNVVGIHYDIPQIDDEDLQGETCIGLLRNTPLAENIQIGQFRFPSRYYDDDVGCYAPYEAVPPIPLPRARQVHITGDLLGVTAALTRLDLPQSCKYHFDFIVDENPRTGHVTNAGYETFSRLDRIWAGKRYPVLQVFLCQGYIYLQTWANPGNFGNLLKMEMSRFEFPDMPFIEPNGLYEFFVFLAYLARQPNFQEMAARVRQLDVNIQLNLEDIDIFFQEACGYLQEFFAVFSGVVHIRAVGNALPFLTDYRHLMRTSVPGAYQPPFPILQRLDVINVDPKLVPAARQGLQELLVLRQSVIPNCPPLQIC